MNIPNCLITVFGMLCVIFLWVVLYDSNRFVVRFHTITDRRILKPVRAVLLADLHNKVYGKDNELLLKSIREQHPDICLIAGDLLTAVPGKKPDVALAFLQELAKDYPIFYGNGNHEQRIKLYPESYGTLGQEFEQGLNKLNIEPLVNSHVLLKEYGIEIYGAEIDRFYYARWKKNIMPKDYLGKLLGQPEKNLFTVLLAHNPEFFEAYASWGADLTLSGHVHGGVVRIPFWGKGIISTTFQLFPKYDGGIFREGNSQMLLSRGLGAHTIPIRAFNPAELWVVDFTPKA